MPIWQNAGDEAKFIAQVMSGDMTIRRLEDLGLGRATYAGSESHRVRQSARD